MLVRDPVRLQGRDWAPRVEAVAGDVLRPETLGAVMDGVGVAYYLVHSMARGEGFHERDLAAARAFGRAAADAGVGRIVYLGGLGDPAADLSQHLRSRQETGEALREAGVPVTEFRAAVVVGSGSISFEMIRYLTERLPVMVCPQWVYTRVQPIAVDDLLKYLVAALDVPESAGRVVEIGGSDVLTYGDMMLGYAAARGLWRHLQPVPVLTPTLSSYWVHLVTPIPSQIARPLIEGLRNEVIVRDALGSRPLPGDPPGELRDGRPRRRREPGHRGGGDALGGRPGDQRRRRAAAGAHHAGGQAHRAPAGAGGRVAGRGVPRRPHHRGPARYRAWDWAWELRGAADRLVGGVGLRRGRRDPADLRVGDALDFWRVEAVEPGRLLRLRAEMKVPGAAWLQFETLPHEGGTRLVQTAYFAPRGLPGLAYWYALLPVHSRIFSGMIAALAVEAGRPASPAGG